jgi:glucose-6-phosphate isomerase
MISLKTSLPSNLPASSFELLSNIPKREFTEWLDLTEDKDKTVQLIKKFVQKKKETWDRVLCLGMGGSALGIVTLQKALFPFDQRLKVLDNLDSNTINYELSILNPERTLVLVISKSGTTLETMTQFEILREKFSDEQYKKNFVIITDPKEGKLRQIAINDQLTSFPIPSMVGGRFSVLTAVGLLPLALLGGDIEELLAGAKAMKEKCLESSENNPALQLASVTHELNKPIFSILIYDDQLSALGFWYQQLLAESIGKTKDIGITPLPLRGASDQHSVLQLLQDGPNDKLNLFLEVINPHVDVIVPGTDAINRVSTVHNILRAELNATEQALREDGRPTIILQIPELSEKTLGELFMLFQMQIAILGEMYGINAFDQPGVEKSKKIVKELLK